VGIGEVIVDLAWPAVVLAVAIIYRSEIEKLLPRIRSAKYKGGEFEVLLDRVEQKIDFPEKETPMIAADAPEVDHPTPTPDSGALEPVPTETVAPPQSIVLDSWATVVDELKKRSIGVPGLRGDAPNQLIGGMEKAGAIWGQTGTVLRELLTMADLAKSGAEITASQAERFVRLARHAIVLLGIPRRGPPPWRQPQAPR
jgi:hypothetical protein